MSVNPVPRTSFGWKVLHSWWVLLSVLGIGCLSGTGFLIIGLRARKPSWWIPGVVYLVAAMAVFGIFAQTEEETTANSGLALLWFFIWLVAIIHSLALNPFWLRWQARHHPPASARLPYGPPGHQFVPAPVTYYAPPPAPAWPAPVDVNNASAAELATLGGFDVMRLVADREARGGFGTLEEFAMVAQLPPHEFLRLRPRLVCNPRRVPGY